MQGFVNILKPSGMTSSDVVVRVRGILRRLTGEKHKVGHLGTLDPGACGVLPIAIGKATRLFNLLAIKGKIYRARITFGTTTDTLDSYGIITKTSNKIPDIEEIKAIISEFIGEIDQIPPNYSALSIDGNKAYDLARQGVEFELKSRKVVINNISIIDYDSNNCIIDIDCNGGTYIRSLVRDIAERLDSVAYMSYLIRLKSGYFNVIDSVTLDEFEANASIIPCEKVLTDYTRYDIDISLKGQLINGVAINLKDLPEGLFTLYMDNTLFGIAHSEGYRLVIDTRLI